MNLFKNLIQVAVNEKTFLDVSRDGYETDSIFGVIFQESESFICLKRFNETGEFDGIVVIRKDDITYIGIGGNQRNATEKLIVDPTELDLEITLDLTSVRSTIESISSKFGHVAIYEEDYTQEFFLGEMIEIDDEYLLLHEYGTRKALDRSKALLRLDLITRIEANGKYERSILQSFSNKMPFDLP